MAGLLVFDAIAAPLAVALGLAVAVERVLELLKNAADLFPGRPTGLPGRSAAALAAPIARLEAFHAAESARERAEEIRARLVALEQDAGGRRLTAAGRLELRELRKLLDANGSELPRLEPDEALPPETILVQEATPAGDGAALRALTLQLVAAALGILAARVFDVRLFDALAPATLPGGLPGGLPDGLPGGVPFDYLLTGLLIGGGSGPVHVLIRFLGERRVAARDPSDTGPEAGRGVPAPGARMEVPVAGGGSQADPPDLALGAAAFGLAARRGVEAGPDTAWSHIPYDGGVDRDRLESVHRRRHDPDTIIYHHTAMPRSSTFDDVVRVIRDRRDARGNRWLTGYNCVITEDGGVHAFCRWDRYGCHAAGWNARSLGIALNGNFETDPTVPFSNPDGRYGPSEPSEAQLEAAARVVALWTLIYDIPLDFDARIIPHRSVSPKTCPGSGFPYARFRALVQRFHDAWAAGPARAHVDAFDRLPYLHA